MSNEIDQYAAEIRHTATVASLNYEIWWVYKGADTHLEFVDTMNRYTLFFQTSIHAHFVALLVALYRLYETRPDTYNIPGFLNLLAERHAIPVDTMTQLHKHYAEAKPLWVKVCILRNKAFVHQSKTHEVSELFAKAEVTPDELRRLVEVTRCLLNAATQAWAQTTHAFNLSSRGDTLRLLGDLKTLRRG